MASMIMTTAKLVAHDTAPTKQEGAPTPVPVASAMPSQDSYAQPYKASPDGDKLVEPQGPHPMGMSSSPMTGLSEDLVRRGFITKVFGILSLMLIETFGIVSVINFNESIRLTVSTNTSLYYGSFFVGMASICFLICKPGAAKSYPTNYAVLIVFAGSQGLMLGTICAYYTLASIYLAVGMTIGVTLGLMCFAKFTSIDFTSKGIYLYTALWVFILWGFVVSFSGLGSYSFMQSAYALCGVAIFAMYIVHDTQLILGGKHKKVQMNTDEYVFAALNLYLDIINMFLYILTLTGDRR